MMLSTRRGKVKWDMRPGSVVFLLSLSLMMAPVLSPAAQKKAEKKEIKAGVILMPIRTSGGVPPDEAAAYEGALIDTLSNKYTVYSGKKVVDKVEEVYRKRSAETQAGKDCDETKCLQDIAMAFQSELIAVTNISKKEDGYFITLKILNVMEDTAVFAKNVPCKGCDSYKVADVLQTLAGGAAPPASAPAVAERPAAVPQSSPPQAKVVVAAPAPARATAAPGGRAAHEGMVFVKQGKGGFYMDKTEVTQEEYLRDIGNNPSKFSACRACPVEQVSWDEANAYCEKAGKRLPTEAEWEYAAASGAKGETFAGTNDESQLGEYAWYGESLIFGQTHPVGQKKPNGMGLHDMSGNVWEWTDGWYDDTKEKRVIRGGSWYDEADNLRAAHREKSAPDGADLIVIGFRISIGFRCAR